MVDPKRLHTAQVHGYVDVDDRRVVAYLQELGDVEGYVTELARLL